MLGTEREGKQEEIPIGSLSHAGMNRIRSQGQLSARFPSGHP